MTRKETGCKERYSRSYHPSGDKKAQTIGWALGDCAWWPRWVGWLWITGTLKTGRTNKNKLFSHIILYMARLVCYRCFKFSSLILYLIFLLLQPNLTAIEAALSSPTLIPSCSDLAHPSHSFSILVRAATRQNWQLESSRPPAHPRKRVFPLSRPYGTLSCTSSWKLLTISEDLPDNLPAVYVPQFW